MWRDSPEIVTKLIHFGAQVPFSLLKHASRDVFQALLGDKTNVQSKIDGNTLLHLAIEQCQHEKAQCLIDDGADIRIRNDNGKTPLDIAVDKDDAEGVKILVKKDDRLPLEVNERGLTPLMRASFDGKGKALEELAKVSVVEQVRGQLSTYQLLIVKKAKPNPANQERSVKSFTVLALSQRTFKLSNELLQFHLYVFLQVSDLENFARVNKRAYQDVREAIIKRARKYGYSGTNLSEAKNYITILFNGVKRFPGDRQHVVMKEKRIDCEQTLVNMIHQTDSEIIDFYLKVMSQPLTSQGARL